MLEKNVLNTGFVLFVLILTWANPANAVLVDPIYFVGIGNYTAGDPDMKAVDTLDNTLRKAAKARGQKYEPTIIKGTETVDVGGTAILNALNQVKAKAKAGDLVVFYYIGHGDTTDATPGQEDGSDKALTKGDEWMGKSSDKLTDDQLSTVLGSMNPSTHKVVIVDSCWSGGMVGGADDIDKASMTSLVYLLSVPEGPGDQGLYEYPPWLKEALEKNAYYKGDKNKDGNVTIGEWLEYGYQKRIDLKQGGSWGYTPYYEGSDTREYVVIPEPATVVLLGLGGLVLLRRRRG